MRVCAQDLVSLPTPGCLLPRTSSLQETKWVRLTCRTSEENLAACSSAISAWESSYKKHLLHFVLSMMLWKINTVMVCLPLLQPLPAWVCAGVRWCACKVHAPLPLPRLFFSVCSRVLECFGECECACISSPQIGCLGQRAQVRFPPLHYWQ